MQITFEAAPFGQRSGHNPGPRRADAIQFGPGGLGLKLGVAQGQPAGAHRRVEQAPVPGQGRVGDDDGDRGAGVGPDHLDEAAVGTGRGQHRDGAGALHGHCWACYRT